MWIAYHWTTRDAAASICQEGARKHTWITKHKEYWHGEICLVVELDMDPEWNNPDKDSWQRCLCDGLPANKFHII